MEKLISLKKISAGYTEPVIRDIDLTLYRNDYLAIIGPNGGGKSTLIKVILGLLKPLSGTIHYHKDLSFGYLPQVQNIDRKFPLSVKEIVLSGLLSKKKLCSPYAEKDFEAVNSILQKLDIENLVDRSIGELSGGQMQRVFLARALISNPDILFLDEPDSFIDKQVRDQLHTMLKKLSEQVSIVMVTHDIGAILPEVKTVACLNQYLHYHGASNTISKITIETMYGCPIELIGHGNTPHRVFESHKH